MKVSHIKFWVFFFILAFSSSARLFAQSTEVQQLLLNVEKLSQLKNILSDMKKGYTVISTGYNAVKNISQGNFSIHEVFLDGLMAVSPEVRRYRRVVDIITIQKDIVSEYKRAFKNFNASGFFTAAELNYLGKLYSGLLSRSMDNLDELKMIITANSLRMNDAERLDAIDRIYLDTTDKLNFLRSFNLDAGKLLLQRKSAMTDLKGSKALFKIN